MICRTQIIPYLKDYWIDIDRYPFLFYAGKKVAGFALVRKEKDLYSVAEFYVLPPYRRRGTRTLTAIKIIKQYHGKWHIEYELRNMAGRCSGRKS